MQDLENEKCLQVMKSGSQLSVNTLKSMFWSVVYMKYERNKQQISQCWQFFTNKIYPECLQ